MADRIVVMNEARIQQVADPLTIATRPATDVVARFMGDNNIIRGTVIERDGDRLVVEDEQHVRASVQAPGAAQAVGDRGHGLRPRGGGDGRRERLRSRRASTRPSARSSSSSSSATSSSSTCSQAASACSPRSAPSSTPSCAAVRASGSGSPGRRRMSSSSTPELPATRHGSRSTRSRKPSDPRAAAAKARPRSATPRRWRRRRRLGDGRPGRARASSGSASTSIAPLVIIVLVSFWTWTDAGFDKTLHDSRTTASSSTTRRTGTTCSRRS